MLIRFILLLLCCCVFYTAHANLYQAAVPVTSQEAAERAKAMQLGLAEVLVRMSGTPAVLEAPKVQASMGNAPRFVNQFQYRLLVEQDSAEQTETAEQPAEELVMTFVPQVIKQLLRDAGEPFWPANRPSVLLWLVEDHPEFGKQFIGDVSDNPVFKSILATARLRGLPLILPLLDLEDQQALLPEQAWSLEEGPILKAASRYKADVVLVGRYSVTSSGQFWSTWEYYHRDESYFYDSRTKDVAEIGSQVINPLANYLASLYSISSQAEWTPQLVMQLQDIDHFGDYQQALNYLDNLAVISQVELSAVRRNTLLLSLRSDGDLQLVTNALALDKRMLPVTVNSVGVQIGGVFNASLGSLENPLQYRWVR